MTHPTTVIKKTRGVMVRDAAAQFDLSEKALFKILCKHGYFNGKFPRYTHIVNGLFTLDQREFTFPNSGAKSLYHVALIRPAGIAMINEIINNSSIVSIKAARNAVREQ